MFVVPMQGCILTMGASHVLHAGLFLGGQYSQSILKFSNARVREIARSAGIRERTVSFAGKLQVRCDKEEFQHFVSDSRNAWKQE